MVRFVAKSTTEMAMIEKYHRQIQGTIIVLANKHLSSEPLDTIKGILKCEGGATVGGSEIMIGRDYVRDDWKMNNDPTKEEEATAKAIEELLNAINFDSEESAQESVKSFILEKLNPREQLLLERFVAEPFSDNLLAFFQKM